MIEYYMKLIKSTISFYENNANELISQYERANMSDLYTFLLENLLPEKRVLDIGFGSGRDLYFLQNHDFDIWGIDPSQNFVDHAKERFPLLKNHFYKASLPDLKGLSKNLSHSFENIILIALWMHIPKELYRETLQAILSLLKPQGRIVLSYSITPRTETTDRYFENVDREYLHRLFENEECSLISEIANKDGLGEREITWVTEAYAYDKS